MGSVKNEQLDQVVRAACAESGLGSDNALLVKNLMRRDPAAWPVCCGSGCSPCTENLVTAALLAKRMLAAAEQAAAADQGAAAADSVSDHTADTQLARSAPARG